jgi:molybdopterin-containing oxidoreductase family iron-sulfur binding subunit
VHRVDRGEGPACVAACTKAGHGAMVFGDLNDPASEIAQAVKKFAARQVREDLDLDTGVRYLGI